MHKPECLGGDDCCDGCDFPPCDRYVNRCGVGEGDCDADVDCKRGLKCGSDNCWGKDGLKEGNWDCNFLGIFGDCDDCCYAP